MGFGTPAATRHDSMPPRRGSVLFGSAASPFSSHSNAARSDESARNEVAFAMNVTLESLLLRLNCAGGMVLRAEDAVLAQAMPPPTLDESNTSGPRRKMSFVAGRSAAASRRGSVAHGRMAQASMHATDMDALRKALITDVTGPKYTAPTFIDISDTSSACDSPPPTRPLPAGTSQAPSEPASAREAPITFLPTPPQAQTPRGGEDATATPGLHATARTGATSEASSGIIVPTTAATSTVRFTPIATSGSTTNSGFSNFSIHMGCYSTGVTVNFTNVHGFICYPIPSLHAAASHLATGGSGGQFRGAGVRERHPYVGLLIVADKLGTSQLFTAADEAVVECVATTLSNLLSRYPAMHMLDGPRDTAQPTVGSELPRDTLLPEFIAGGDTGGRGRVLRTNTTSYFAKRSILQETFELPSLTDMTEITAHVDRLEAVLADLRSRMLQLEANDAGTQRRMQAQHKELIEARSAAKKHAALAASRQQTVDILREELQAKVLDRVMSTTGKVLVRGSDPTSTRSSYVAPDWRAPSQVLEDEALQFVHRLSKKVMERDATHAAREAAKLTKLAQTPKKAPQASPRRHGSASPQRSGAKDAGDTDDDDPNKPPAPTLASLAGIVAGASDPVKRREKPGSARPGSSRPAPGGAAWSGSASLASSARTAADDADRAKRRDEVRRAVADAKNRQASAQRATPRS